MTERLVIREARAWPTAADAGSLATVVVEEGRITEVSHRQVPARPGDWIIEARGRLLTPGFVDAHSHVTRKLSVGLCEGRSYPKGHPQLEEPLRGRFERALELEDVAVASRLAFCEAALAGTTTVFEQLRAPACADGSLDAVGNEARAVGLRAVISYGASERDGAAAVGIQECTRFANEAAADKFGPLVRGSLGLAHAETVSTALLGGAAQLAHTAGLQVHAAETEEELADAFLAYGNRGLERLAEIGMLGQMTVASHGNHLNRREGEILAEIGGFCAYTPRSALLAEERPPRLEAAVDAGTYAVLGTDGLSPSVRGEIPWALALWRRTARPGGQQGFYAIERMAVEAGGRLMGRFFGCSAGLIAVGQAADLVLLDYRPGTPLKTEAMVGHLVPGISEAHVAWTIVGGRVLVREGALLTVDWAEAAAKSQERAERLWNRL
jgi:cytosine/adenosine deaminase-related metal-dependent hydrolase